MLVLIHLAHLKSFGIPYLMPFVGADLNDYEDERDFLWRLPMHKLNRRPIYARREESVKLRFLKRDREKSDREKGRKPYVCGKP